MNAISQNDIGDITLMIVDDHPALRTGLQMILEGEPDLSVVAQAGGVTDAVLLFKQFKPDVTVMDIKLQDGSGIDAADAIRAESPRARIVFLTSFDRDEDIYRCMRSGAAGYIVKDTPAAEIIAAIRQVHQGKKHFPALVAEKLSDRLAMDDLSDREMSVLKLMTEGRSNKEIASDLGIALGTVKYHINNLLVKLQAEDRTQAVVIALRKGMTEL